MKLAQLTVPAIREFEDKLLRGDPAPGETQGKRRSRAMVGHIRVALGACLSDAQERGLVAKNPRQGHAPRAQRQKDPQDRQRGRLRIGKDIPTTDEIRRIIGALDGVARRYRVLLLVAVFTGLRASELRGLHWKDIDFSKRELHVTQRADRYREIGPPKSKAGSRSLPLTPQLLQALREWRLETGARGLVFGTTADKPDAHSNILTRGFHPAQVRAGVIDAKGRPKYTGLHSLRHFFASWCINRKADGGLELPLKLVQTRMGHSSISITGDVYGHLFPSGDDLALLAGAEKALWG